MNSRTPTVRAVLNRIAKECRENIEAFEAWQDNPPRKAGKGALGEARGTVSTSREILKTIRELRRRL